VDILNRQRKSITGPVLKSRQEITEDILNRKSLREYLAAYADKTGTPLRKVNKKAAGYIDEIASNYSLRVINFLDWIFTWVFKNIFEGISVSQDEINMMRETYTKAPLILIPCHKSHLDYLLLPYVMYKNNMPCPPHCGRQKPFLLAPWPFIQGCRGVFPAQDVQGRGIVCQNFLRHILKNCSMRGLTSKFILKGAEAGREKYCRLKSAGSP
jgi:Glycerol-3-phosphate O-acyltransferase